jgi:hypothetical protein
MSINYITNEVRALKGVETDFIETCHLVEASEVRRFHQALMDDSPRYWGEGNSRYGGPVAPFGFPVHAMRRAPSASDPLSAMSDPNFDGIDRSLLRPGLPPVPVPLTRLLNGGYEYRLFRYANINDRILVKSRYIDIYQRAGKTGEMVFLVIEDTYVNQRREKLIKTINTMIMR